MQKMQSSYHFWQIWSHKRVLQSGTGCEWNDHLIASIVKDWPGGGLAEVCMGGYYIQSQGPRPIEERGNRTHESKIACKFLR